MNKVRFLIIFAVISLVWVGFVGLMWSIVSADTIFVDLFYGGVMLLPIVLFPFAYNDMTK